MAHEEDQIPEEMQLDTGADIPEESPEEAAAVDEIIAAKDEAEFDWGTTVDALNTAFNPQATPAALAYPQQDTPASRSNIEVDSSVPTSIPGSFNNSAQDPARITLDALGQTVDSMGQMTPQQLGGELLNEPTIDVTQDTTLPALPTSSLESAMSSMPVTSSAKIGSQISVPQTQEFLNAQGAVHGDVKNIQGVLQQKQNQLTELQQIAAPLEAKREQIAQAHLDKLDSIQAKGEADYAQAREEATKLRQEMANTPWTTFWGSKSTGDKLLLSMAVGLGAYSQARVGGQNVVLGMIQDQIQEHNVMQKNIHQNLRDRLSATSADAQTILTGTQHLQKIENTRNIAAYDQVQKELDMMQSRVKTEQAKSNLQILSSQVAMKSHELDLKYAQETKLKSTLTTDVLVTTNASIPVGNAQFVNAKGQIEDMTESDKIRYGYMNEQAVTNKDMTALEKAGVLDDKNYAILWNLVTNPPASHTLKEVRGLADYLSMGGLTEDTVNKNPRLRQYYQSVMNSADPAGRAKSGGVMTMGEMAGYIRQRMPSPQDMNTPGAEGSLQNVQTFRKNELKSKRGLLNANHIKFSFEGE
jgi:hypothetical protein